MSDFKLCKNGHYYHNSYEECPYCPKAPSAEKGQGVEKTKIEGSNAPIDKTVIYHQDSPAASAGKTKIYHQENDSGQPDFVSGQNKSGRKLTGWLVSYTIDPLGADFRLFEGRNIIGSDPACDIVIPNDPAVSGKHLTILYRMGVFKFKDELSTNGTFINNEFKEEGTLNDGDLIKIGNTLLKFRIA